MNLHAYIESLPSVQSPYYSIFYNGVLSEVDTLTLAQKIIDCGLTHFCIGNTEGLHYTQPKFEYEFNPLVQLQYPKEVTFYFEYPVPDFYKNHRRYTFKLGIDFMQFRSMLIYKTIDYDKPIGE